MNVPLDKKLFAAEIGTASRYSTRKNGCHSQDSGAFCARLHPPVKPKGPVTCPLQGKQRVHGFMNELAHTRLGNVLRIRPTVLRRGGLRLETSRDLCGLSSRTSCQSGRIPPDSPSERRRVAIRRTSAMRAKNNCGFPPVHCKHLH